MRDIQAGGKSGLARLILAGFAVAVTAAVAWAVIGAQASAQEPCPVAYCIPTPTPTGTPFTQPGPTATPSSPKLMSPFPKIRTAGSYTRTRTMFTRVTVRGPRGARLDARCSGKRCKRTRRTLGRKALRIRAMQRSFPAGTRLTLRVSGPGTIGKYVEIRTRRGKAPVRRDRCLNPGSTKPAGCPSR